jgi:uncharacterized membrane protein
MADSALSVRLTESTRVEAFSDAVMAIVITLLVLELRVRPHEPGQLLPALVGAWASVVGFLVSFVRVSVIWLNHHALFARVRSVDRRLLWMNLGILFNCTIIPFPTAVLSDALRGGDPSDLRAATVVYVVLAALQSAAWIPVFPYLRDHPELVEPGTDAAFFDAQRARPWIGVGTDVAAAAVGTMFPVPALVLWTLSVIFLAATSDGVTAISFRLRRHAGGQRR